MRKSKKNLKNLDGQNIHKQPCNKAYYYSEFEVQKTISYQEHKFANIQLDYYYCDECIGFHITERIE